MQYAVQTAYAERAVVASRGVTLLEFSGADNVLMLSGQPSWLERLRSLPPDFVGSVKTLAYMELVKR